MGQRYLITTIGKCPAWGGIKSLIVKRRHPCQGWEKKGSTLTLKGQATLDHTSKSFTDCGILLLTLQSSKSLKLTFNFTQITTTHYLCFKPLTICFLETLMFLHSTIFKLPQLLIFIDMSYKTHLETYQQN